MKLEKEDSNVCFKNSVDDLADGRDRIKQILIPRIIGSQEWKRKLWVFIELTEKQHEPWDIQGKPNDNQWPTTKICPKMGMKGEEKKQSIN